MSFDSLMIHTLSVVRQVETGDEDEYGQPVREPQTIETFSGDAQVKGAREIARRSEAGPVVGAWTLYTRPRDILTSDAILHDPTVCGLARDLPAATWELKAVNPRRDRTGIHHFEIDADLIASPEPVEAGS